MGLLPVLMRADQVEHKKHAYRIMANHSHTSIRGSEQCWTIRQSDHLGHGLALI